MAINAWWTGNPHQRFWMEATDRKDLGEALRAPKGGTADQPVWNYELVAYTNPGDVVFHWHTELAKRPALVGWSTVVGPLSEGEFPWVPKQGGDKSTANVLRPHWVMPLGGLHLLDVPITIDDLFEIRGELLETRVELEQELSGASYFPFNKYGADGLRAMQGYLTKFPAQLVTLLQTHFDLELDEGDGVAIVGDSIELPTPKGGQGVLTDTARRLAIERYAVDRAIEYYAGLGATDITELGKPYDLRLQLAGHEIHVEVKGSGAPAATVIVTRNEVSHAHAHAKTELFVVDNVTVAWLGDVLTVSGGKSRRWVKWAPAAASLSARTYDHALDDTYIEVGLP